MLSYARKGKNWVLRGVYPAPIELDRPRHPAASWGKIQSVDHFKGDLFLLLANSDLGAPARGLCSAGRWELPLAQNLPHVQLEQAQVEREQLPAIW